MNSCFLLKGNNVKLKQFVLYSNSVVLYVYSGLTVMENGKYRNIKQYFPMEMEILTISRQEVTKDDRSGMGKI